MSNNKQGLFDALAENPRNLWAWCCLRDILEAEGEPDEVLKVCDQAGIWIGSREDWEREGPLVVDRVPVVRVWVLDCAPATLRDGEEIEDSERNSTWSWFLLGVDDIDGAEHPANDELPPLWHNKPVGPSDWEVFDTVTEAQAWLTQIALEYARRVRDERKKDEVQP